MKVHLLLSGGLQSQVCVQNRSPNHLPVVVEVQCAVVVPVCRNTIIKKVVGIMSVWGQGCWGHGIVGCALGSSGG